MDEENLVTDMLYELDEIDAQVNELQALYTVRMLESGGRDATEEYENEIEDIKQEIGVLREELRDDVGERAMDKRSFVRRAQEALMHVRRTLGSVRRQFLYRY